jgi:hypothetical protein
MIEVEKRFKRGEIGDQQRIRFHVDLLKAKCVKRAKPPVSRPGVEVRFPLRCQPIS